MADYPGDAGMVMVANMGSRCGRLLGIGRLAGRIGWSV
jgi:hypothetical protein